MGNWTPVIGAIAVVAVTFLLAALLFAPDAFRRLDLRKSVDEQMEDLLVRHFTRFIKKLRKECARAKSEARCLPKSGRQAALNSIEQYYVSCITKLCSLNMAAAMHALEANDLALQEPYGRRLPRAGFSSEGMT